LRIDGAMTTPATSPGTALDATALEGLRERLIRDLGGSVAAAAAVIGDRLGLYRALADGGPQTSAELAERTGTYEPYVREWLTAEARYGYVTHDPEAARFSLAPEQAACLADEAATDFLADAFDTAAAIHRERERLLDGFRTGRALDCNGCEELLFRGADALRQRLSVSPAGRGDERANEGGRR
jgi:hypothetical protein